MSIDTLDELRRTLITVRRSPDAVNARVMAIALAERAIALLAVTKPDLKKLVADTNTVLEAVFEIRNTIEGAINWGDLSCRSAASGIRDDGSPFLAVWIEEAAPSNYDFQLMIFERLKDMGYEHVEVITEW